MHRPRPVPTSNAPVAAARRLDLEVVVPVRWEGPVAEAVADDFVRSLDRTARCCDVTVVDGSTGPGSEARRASWARHARVLRPDPRWRGTNGKVSGAVTGVLAARHELVVIGDDDVRHDAATLALLVAALGRADLVVPQNHPTRWTWWAWCEAGRVLLNRAVATDWPGTLAVRRSVVVATGGWSAQVLFENLELARTVRAHGGRVVRRRDVLVPREPPTLRHFLRQRVRQAYEDQAQAGRLVLGLAVVPSVVALRRHHSALGALAAAAVLVAERGRRRDGGRRAFPWWTSAAAPVWLLERGLFTWVAVLARFRGGIRYGGGRMHRAAHPRARRGHP